MTGTLPVRAAIISGVSPLARVWLGSAPAFSSSFTRSALPASHASDSGVMPFSIAAPGLACARRSAAVSFTSP